MYLLAVIKHRKTGEKMPYNYGLKNLPSPSLIKSLVEPESFQSAMCHFGWSCKRYYMVCEVIQSRCRFMIFLRAKPDITIAIMILHVWVSFASKMVVRKIFFYQANPPSENMHR